MKKRKIASVAIVLSGLILFFLITGQAAKNTPNSGVVGASDQNLTNTNLQFQTNKDRNLVSNPVADQNTQNSDNLTDQLAQSFSQTVLQMNNGFSNGTSSISLPTSDSFNSVLNQSLTQDLQFPTFTNADIRIDPDNSTSSQLAYITAVGEISKKNFAGFKADIATIVNNFFNNNDPSGLVKYVSIAGKMTSDLLALKVPAQLSVWHLQNLNLWEKKITVYQAILDMSSDPLKTSLALQQINDIGQENENLQNIIGNFVKKID